MSRDCGFHCFETTDLLFTFADGGGGGGEGHLKDWSLFVDVVNRGPLIVPWLNKSSC